MAKEQTPTWVKDLIVEAKVKAGNAANLAKKLHISQANFVNYDSGTTPSIQIIERLLKYVGGDIKRALPSYVPASKEQKVVYEIHDSDDLDFERPPQNSIFIWGQVAAGKVTFAGEDQGFKTVDSLWAESRYWGLTTGPIAYVEVHGESMTPQYKPGEVLACRQPCDWQSLPNGTPCVFQEGDEDELTFKILHKTDTGDIVGQPLNQDYPMIVFKKKSVRIQLVVLGKVQLEKKSVADGVIEVKSKKKIIKE